MPRRASLQNTFTRGVLDPTLSERRDLEHYESGLEDGVNHEVVPQGAARRRAGTSLRPGYRWRDYDHRIRRRIRPVHLTSSMLTAHNGGTKANIIDQNTATFLTTNSVGASTFVLIEVDLGEARPICFVDVLNYSCATGRFNNVLAVEWWNGSAWVAVAGAADPDGSPRRSLATAARTRRFGEWPGGPAGAAVSAQIWRVVLYSAVGAGVIKVGDIRFWEEARETSANRIVTFARSSDAVYELVLTERNIDVYEGHLYRASIPVQVAAHQVEEVTFHQALDSLFVFHEDIPPQQIIIQGSATEWTSGTATITNIPNLTPGNVVSGDTDEVQELSLAGITEGREFVIWSGNSVTAPITYAAASVASDVATALGAVATIGTPPSVTLLSGVDPVLRVSFVGGLGARRWPALDAVPLDDDPHDFSRRTVQRGLLANGPLMGATTGYPRCGTITQDRLVLAGFRSAPETLAFSRIGDFSLAQTASPMTSDLAIVATLQTAKSEVIRQIVVGPHIQVLTDASEWYIEARTLDALQPINAVRATGNGLQGAVRVQPLEGATYFIQRGGAVLRSLEWQEVELYRSDPISLLSPHLLSDVVDMAARPARGTDEANQVFLVNRDGDLAFGSLLPEQKVVAFTPWQARDGRVKSVAANEIGEVWLTVEREAIDGLPDVTLERLDDRHTLDAAIVYYRAGLAVATLDGLDVHEGREVWAWADGALVGPLRVTDGEITLADPAAEIIVGLAPAIYGELLPIRPRLEEQPFRPPARIYEVELALAATGNIEISTNGGPWRAVDLDPARLDINAPVERDAPGIYEPSPTDGLENMVRALCMIPASGEHVLADRAVTKTGFGLVNAFDENETPVFLASLGQARQAFPRLEHVSLFVAWFGNDLRCGSTAVKPKTEDASATTTQAWTVAGETRSTAAVVSTSGGKPAYGGTPADISVVQAIQALKAQNVGVTFTPFVLMDIPAGNSLPDPYGGAAQAVYPWRGRITCNPAPGMSGTVDLTAGATSQIANFMGNAAVGDFSIVGTSVTYSGPSGWAYRRFILHYAHLCKAAGGVDTFVIGSEMRGLEWVRSALGVYPFVDALVTLAADVRSVLGAETNIVYATDWSSFGGHQTGVSGELFFNLDPLWSSPNIDAIGIDNYWPLADWRDGSGHADWAEGFTSPYDRAYLQGNIFGGEGYDWYYASSGDRDAQTRTSITDGAYGEPWVWRYKDIKSWWSNAHHNRPAGVRDASATAWVPKSKPIWFMETGCPAIDKGANQPNVFTDPKSSESAAPYYSRGVRDDRAQRSYLEAMLAYFDESRPGFDAAVNPQSDVYSGRMVDASRLYVYTWDARYHPIFPGNSDFYGDAALWQTGHWLTGRVTIPSMLDGIMPIGRGAELPTAQRLFTGNIRVVNLQGWSAHPKFRWRQVEPAPLEIRAIRLEVAHG